MNSDILFSVIVLVIIIFLVFFNKSEHLNEGTFYNLDTNVINNLDSQLYPMCEKDIRSTPYGLRYCNDLPNYQKYTKTLYNSPKWVQTKYPSYFYPPYSMSDKPHHMYSPDWWHRYDSINE